MLDGININLVLIFKIDANIGRFNSDDDVFGVLNSFL